MNKTTKTIISVFIMLILLGTVVEAGPGKLIRPEIPEPKEVIPDDVTNAIVTPTYATTYTDLWTKSATNQFYSGTWKDVLTQTIYTRYPSNLLVQFSTEVDAGERGWIELRVLVDGVVISPGTIVLTEANTYGPRSFNFHKEYVGTGTHTVKVQTNGDNSYLGYRSLAILANGYGH